MAGGVLETDMIRPGYTQLRWFLHGCDMGIWTLPEYKALLLMGEEGWTVEKP